MQILAGAHLRRPALGVSRQTRLDNRIKSALAQALSALPTVGKHTKLEGNSEEHELSGDLRTLGVIAAQ